MKRAPNKPTPTVKLYSWLCHNMSEFYLLTVLLQIGISIFSKLKGCEYFSATTSCYHNMIIKHCMPWYFLRLLYLQISHCLNPKFKQTTHTSHGTGHKPGPTRWQKHRGGSMSSSSTLFFLSISFWKKNLLYCSCFTSLCCQSKWARFISPYHIR